MKIISYDAPKIEGKTQFAFQAEATDLRTGERVKLEIGSHSKANAGKLAKEYGYKVHDMCFI